MKYFLTLLLFTFFLYAQEDNLSVSDSNQTDDINQSISPSKEPTLIEATALGRYMNNNNFFTNSPYGFLLFETNYAQEEWSFAGGVFAQKGLPYPDIPLNHLYVDYYDEDFHFRIGKTFAKIGVLDHFSMLDTLNPIRLEFFDDPKMTIKRIPLWMIQTDIEPYQDLKLSFFVQPYDSEHQDYTGFYVNYMLDRFVPQHYPEFFAQDPIGQTIFAPLYYNAISPFIAHDIESKKSSGRWRGSNTSLGFVAEKTDENQKIGFVYFNRYSEVPLIRVDQNLVNAALTYENGGNAVYDLSEYLASLDLDPIKSVQGFRYNQVGIYAETTLDSYGIRAEASYRDKIPLINSYGTLTSLGFSVDHLDEGIYNAFETQWIHLDEYNANAYIAMLTTKFEPFFYSSFKAHFENRLIGAHVDFATDVAFNPGFVLEYNDTILSLQGMISRHNNETNGISLSVRTVF